LFKDFTFHFAIDRTNNTLIRLGTSF